jgi:hypothetical protein
MAAEAKAEPPPPPPPPPPPSAFFSHTWREDTYGRDNHKRVMAIANAVKAQGINVWIDEEEMTGAPRGRAHFGREKKRGMAAGQFRKTVRVAGDILNRMCEGIEGSDVTVVFVTQEYLLKVQKKDHDNCKFEFNYALQRQGLEKMLPVVMEEALADTRAWTGPVAGVLGNVLHVPMWEDGEQLQASIAQLAAEIRKRVVGDGASKEETSTDPIPPIPGEATVLCGTSVVPTCGGLIAFPGWQIPGRRPRLFSPTSRGQTAKTCLLSRLGTVLILFPLRASLDAGRKWRRPLSRHLLPRPSPWSWQPLVPSWSRP